MSTIQNSRFIDMGVGADGRHFTAEMISHQVQVFWDPTYQRARVSFNGAKYMLMGATYQRIGLEQEIIEQDLNSYMHLKLIPPGTLDPVTGFDLSNVSMAGIVLIHKGAYDFFHNVHHKTPGYPSLNTVVGSEAPLGPAP